MLDRKKRVGLHHRRRPETDTSVKRGDGEIEHGYTAANVYEWKPGMQLTSFSLQGKPQPS
jgi:hypothetical protein